MAFASRLRKLLSFRETLMPGEFAKGEPLESVLDRYLLVVESTAESDTITSILLLDGTTLHHGAAPKLPQEYGEAINGSQIGPMAGSCGTAAFFGRPVYVSDICNDPLWENYRHLAVEHDFRACWSTPIRNSKGKPRHVCRLSREPPQADAGRAGIHRGDNRARRPRDHVHQGGGETWLDEGGAGGRTSFPASSASRRGRLHRD